MDRNYDILHIWEVHRIVIVHPILIMLRAFGSMLMDFLYLCDGFWDKLDIKGPTNANFQSLNFLLAHLAKGNVSFCHHLASVVRLLFTF